VPARFFDAASLAREEPRLSSPSETARRAVGIAGVAEAAALACVGANGRLLVAKQRSRRATCALAISRRAPGTGTGGMS
jgi:cobalt-precorrin 5A hydrolase/precorrin-3B C17-methyltransferase